MKLAEFLSREMIFDGLQAGDLEALFDELVGRLVQAGRVAPENRKRIVQGLIARERLLTGAMGQGVAIIHFSDEAIPDLLVALGRSARDLPFNPPDGEPVRLVVVLLSSMAHNTQYLKTISHLARILRDKLRCRCLNNAKDSDEFWELLEEGDRKLAEG